MTKFVVRLHDDSKIPDVNQVHVFHNEEDMKDWFHTCGHFQSYAFFEDGGTFIVKHGVWKGSFSIDKAESHL